MPSEKQSIETGRIQNDEVRHQPPENKDVRVCDRLNYFIFLLKKVEGVPKLSSLLQKISYLEKNLQF